VSFKFLALNKKPYLLFEGFLEQKPSQTKVGIFREISYKVDSLIKVYYTSEILDHGIFLTNEPDNVDTYFLDFNGKCEYNVSLDTAIEWVVDYYKANSLCDLTEQKERFTLCELIKIANKHDTNIYCKRYLYEDIDNISKLVTPPLAI
jgi:hypothetical protein